MLGTQDSLGTLGGPGDPGVQFQILFSSEGNSVRGKTLCSSENSLFENASADCVLGTQGSLGTLGGPGDPGVQFKYTVLLKGTLFEEKHSVHLRILCLKKPVLTVCFDNQGTT